MTTVAKRSRANSLPDRVGARGRGAERGAQRTRARYRARYGSETAERACIARASDALKAGEGSQPLPSRGSLVLAVASAFSVGTPEICGDHGVRREHPRGAHGAQTQRGRQEGTGEERSRASRAAPPRRGRPPLLRRDVPLPPRRLRGDRERVRAGGEARARARARVPAAVPGAFPPRAPGRRAGRCHARHLAGAQGGAQGAGGGVLGDARADGRGDRRAPTPRRGRHKNKTPPTDRASRSSTTAAWYAWCASTRRATRA